MALYRIPESLLGKHLIRGEYEKSSGGRSVGACPHCHVGILFTHVPVAEEVFEGGMGLHYEGPGRIIAPVQCQIHKGICFIKREVLKNPEVAFCFRYHGSSPFEYIPAVCGSHPCKQVLQHFAMAPVQRQGHRRHGIRGICKINHIPDS